MPPWRRCASNNKLRTRKPTPHQPPPATPEVVFDPPMPPELPPLIEPAPAPEPPPSPDQTRASATEAARAAVRRRLFCYEHLMARHPELSAKIQDLSDAPAYFDADDNLLPPELWPDSTHSIHHPGHHAGNSPD
jgi:hypothetical protein